MPQLQDIVLVVTVILVAFAPMHASLLQTWAEWGRDGVKGPPRARDDRSGRILSGVDMVPILSWLWRREGSSRSGQARHPRLLYSEVVILLVAAWGAFVVPWRFAIPTVLLAGGLQAVVLLTGPNPRAAKGFVAALALFGLATVELLLPEQLAVHVGAMLLGLALWVAARLQRAIAPDALILLIPAGAFAGFLGLAITGFLSIPAAFAFRAVKPALYPAERRRPVMPAEAVVFGLAAAIWLVWLYLVAT